MYKKTADTHRRHPNNITHSLFIVKSPRKRLAKTEKYVILIR